MKPKTHPLDFAGFRHAFRGIFIMVRDETNARIHLVATLVVVGLGLWLHIVALEWIALFLSFGLVWAAEALNTALERLTDLVSPGQRPEAGNVKDLAAAGVLLAAIAAAGVGVMIFLPKILTLIFLAGR